MDGLALFLIVFLVTNVCCSGVLAALLLRWTEDPALRGGTALLLALGLGPILVSLLLYYMLWLLPGLPPLAGVAITLLPFVVAGLFVKAGWKQLPDLIVKTTRAMITWGDRGRIPSSAGLVAFSLFLVAAALFTWNSKPLIDHDVLEYALKGRLFARDMAVQYERFPFDAASGFYYVGLHGFGFPLLGSWETIWGNIVGLQGDLWFRSITAWYCWLLIILIWRTLRAVDERAAWVGLLTLPPTFGFIFLFTTYHLDALRAFLFTSSVLLQLRWMVRPSRSVLLLFAMFAGLHAFTHSLGAIIGCAQLAILLITAPGGFVRRVRNALIAVAVFLAAGGIHYVVDVISGTGWIFKDIDFY